MVKNHGLSSEITEEQKKVCSGVTRITPKLPQEMTNKELMERKRDLERRMLKAARNFESLYYDDMKDQMDAVKAEIKVRVAIQKQKQITA